MSTSHHKLAATFVTLEICVHALLGVLIIIKIIINACMSSKSDTDIVAGVHI